MRTSSGKRSEASTFAAMNELVARVQLKFSAVSVAQTLGGPPPLSSASSLLLLCWLDRRMRHARHKRNFRGRTVIVLPCSRGRAHFMSVGFVRSARKSS